MAQTGVILAAGGIGRRMGAKCPKQYLELFGTPILIHALRKFDFCDFVSEIVIVVPSEEIPRTETLVKNYQIQKVKCVVAGGQERQVSVENGLKALSESVDIVLVHDAVRPFVSIAKIQEVITAAEFHGAAVLAVPEKCTVKLMENGQVRRTVDRTHLWQAQTPQGIRRTLFLQAFDHLEKHPIQVTDSVSLVEHFGKPVKVVQGDPTNIKITTPEDMLFAHALADFLIQEEEICV